MTRSLADLQARVHALLRREVELAPTAEALGVPADRLGLYRDFVLGHVARVLGKVLPSVVAVAGPRWDAIAQAFFREVPTTSRELNAAVAPFPAWLDRRGAELDATLPPWLAALAQLEWERFAAWAHEADVPGPPSSPERPDALAVNPTLAALEVTWDVVPWLMAHDDPRVITPDVRGPARLDAPRVALVFRRAVTHRVAMHVADDALLFGLKVVTEGVALERAAALAGATRGAARAAIERAIDLGLIVSASPDPIG
ncbi:MAG: putative DNA-binding domain-containing protein [Deltaproteobacteria bacterium]|nr:putative DNA-binding domain-containing protein [Deltaproteobacteria bacterium]